MVPRARAFAGDRRATAMYEFALAVPLLLIILAGGYEFSRALWEYQLASKGVRDAARYLARVNDPTSSGSQTIATNLVVRGSAGTTAAPRLDPSDVSVSVTTQAYDNSAGTYRGPDGASADINVVTVRAQISYQGALLGFLQIG